jgi:hypothetical protein
VLLADLTVLKRRYQLTRANSEIAGRLSMGGQNLSHVSATTPACRSRKHGKFSRGNIRVPFSIRSLICITHETVENSMFTNLLAAMFYSSAIAYGRIRVLLNNSSANAELARK